MKYVIAWHTNRAEPSMPKYFVGWEENPTVFLITSDTTIAGAKAFDSRQNARWVINKIERHATDLGIVDIVEMTDKELFEARLKGA